MMATPIPLIPQRRQADVRAGVQIEIVTVIWMTIEATVAIGAGVLAHSVLLTAFGLDSVIELISGGALLWRLVTEARGKPMAQVERAERRAAWVAGIALVLLCLYIVVTVAISLLSHNHPDSSPAGIGLAVLALIVMPGLVRQKRRIGDRIKSAALRADAACSLTCAYMAATLLAGLLLTAAFGWWWADAVAALALLYWIVPEAREALEGARAGRGGCACGEPTGGAP
jgi:divalent metal cation (Fe/Co/Zn/Cd) transporter